MIDNLHCIYSIIIQYYSLILIRWTRKSDFFIHYLQTPKAQIPQINLLTNFPHVFLPDHRPVTPPISTKSYSVPPTPPPAFLSHTIRKKVITHTQLPILNWTPLYDVQQSVFEVRVFFCCVQWYVF